MSSTEHISHTAAAVQTEPAACLLDTPAVAELIGCSTRHVQRLVLAGQIPAPLRIGGLVRWRRDELLAWIEAGCPVINDGGGS